MELEVLKGKEEKYGETHDITLQFKTRFATKLRERGQYDEA